MSHKTATVAHTIGIDTGKNTLHLIGLDDKGAIVLREKIARGEEIEVLAQESESCRQLMTVPGIGPLIASAMVAAIGNGAAFAKGRDFAAWLGLVPKQMSTGDRTILGRITKRGNRYLRTLIMQGARVILLRPANWAKHSFGPIVPLGQSRSNPDFLLGGRTSASAECRHWSGRAVR
jgi:hypothetical protein